MAHSIEGYGLSVPQLAEAAGMRYSNGPNTVTFFGAILYREQGVPGTVRALRVYGCDYVVEVAGTRAPRAVTPSQTDRGEGEVAHPSVRKLTQAESQVDGRVEHASLAGDVVAREQHARIGLVELEALAHLGTLKRGLRLGGCANRKIDTF